MTLMKHPLSPQHRGTLIAHADDVAQTFIERWGRAVIGDPTYTDQRGWHIMVIGLLDDIQMDTVVVYRNGGRDLIS